MPPKAKLHKTTGKSSISINSAQPSTSNGITMTPEQEQQFEVELCWCIQQLQIALKSGKLNNKQVQDHTKTLNTLMSNTAPIAKKRQIMRLSFGDYREKMAKEEKRANKSISLKVKAANPSSKSVFIKKAIVTPSDNNFKFNFSEPEADSDISDDKNFKNSENESAGINKCDFVRTDNSFRFNFDISENS